MSDFEAFYMPSSDMFGHPDAYNLFTRYALEEAGLADRFPADPELRKIAIELLAEGDYVVEDVAEEPETHRRRHR